MPSTIDGLLRSAGLQPDGVCRWRNSVDSSKAGVYFVSLSPDPKSSAGLRDAPVSDLALLGWIRAVPAMTVDGARATAEALRARLSAFWLPDESILYIGKAGGGSSRKTLRQRVREYYRTELGQPRPHSGGHWLKTLSNLGSLAVHWSECLEPEETEKGIIEEFVRRVSPASRRALFDPGHPYPFANLELTKGLRKMTGIGGSRAPREVRLG